ncbi:hypothetical protein D3C78_1010840 [compost metagenome]
MIDGDVGVTSQVCCRIIGAHFLKIVIALIPLLELVDLRGGQPRKQAVDSLHMAVEEIGTLRVGVIERFHHFVQLRVDIEQAQGKRPACRSLAPHLMKNEVDEHLHLFHLVRHVGVRKQHQPCASPLPG